MSSWLTFLLILISVTTIMSDSHKKMCDGRSLCNIKINQHNISAPGNPRLSMSLSQCTCGKGIDCLQTSPQQNRQITFTSKIMVSGHPYLDGVLTFCNSLSSRRICRKKGNKPMLVHGKDLIPDSLDLDCRCPDTSSTVLFSRLHFFNGDFSDSYDCSEFMPTCETKQPCGGLFKNTVSYYCHCPGNCRCELPLPSDKSIAYSTCTP